MYSIDLGKYGIVRVTEPKSVRSVVERYFPGSRMWAVHTQTDCRIYATLWGKIVARVIHT